jgi:tripartite-type tricarboxylate transporter receptor subunit TctC
MRAAPDGYTIQMGQTGTHAASVALYPNLVYRPDVDFEPIGMVVVPPILIAARKDFPAKDLKEFMAYARANPDKLNMAHAGVGSITHFTCLMLNAMLGIKPAQVPFSGSAPAINALVAGQVDYICDPTPDIVQQLQGGTLRVYAIASPTRSPILPDVPTTIEAGLPEFQVIAWYGLFAPRGTPKPILDKLSGALDVALDNGSVRKRLLDLGCDIPDKAQRGQAQLAALVKSEIARWGPIIKAANKAD